MKVLSLQPPWPYAIFRLGKDVENRNWWTRFTGTCLIHASKTWDDEGFYFIKGELGLYVPSKHLHVFGAIQGQVEIYGCVKEFGSPWFSGKYGFLLTNPVEFEIPIPMKGQLGFFEAEIKGEGR